jgi:hypothetical protein
MNILNLLLAHSPRLSDYSDIGQISEPIPPIFNQLQFEKKNT